jgi:methylamine---glutamate N-methyltransferase subunit C
MRKKLLDENEEAYRTLEQITSIADKGKSTLCSMGSQKRMPFSLNDLHLVPAQISKIPLNANETVTPKLLLDLKQKSL